MKTSLTLTFIALCLFTFGQKKSLFKITQHDRVGYINETGKIVINPIFLSGNDFSEGLAAVRLNGTYGFINESGTFVIKPDYDFAANFANGLAVVYNKGVRSFIGKSGNLVLSPVYKSLSYIGKRKAIVTTNTNRQGLIDIHTKQLLIDTVFGAMKDLNNGLFAVSEYNAHAEKERKKGIAVIDTLGHIIVPFDKYVTIKPFIEGYASVEIKDNRNKDGNSDGVIDTKGKLLFERPYKNNSYVDGVFHDGYAKVSLYKYWIPEEKGVLSTSAKSYEGFINLKGEVVFNDTNYSYVKEFANGRAFIKENNEDYILVDKNFRQVSNNKFHDIPAETFKNGYAIVETSEGFGIIDTLGNFVTKSVYDNIDEIGIVDGYFFYANESENKALYGIADLKGNVICKPIMQEFDRHGFVNGLLKAVINGNLSYINKNGAIVWQQESDSSTTLKPLDIDFMNRGYFYASSTPKNTDTHDYNGWATSANQPNKIANVAFPMNSLSITIDTNNIDTFANRFLGFKLFISNTTKDTVKLNAEDSRIYMKLQAQNEKGEWKDIEYLPSSWCGNSYHKIELEPGAFWKFVIPRYYGAFLSKIRAELRYIANDNLRTEKVVYSNIITGSINPGQFWNKREYYPNGFMDPYDD